MSDRLTAIANSICGEYTTSTPSDSRTPVRWSAGQGKGESFTAYTDRGVLHLKFSGTRGVISGIEQAITVVKAQHSAELPTHVQPEFSQRCLWWAGNSTLHAGDVLQLALPRELGLQDELDRYARRVYELGYNTVIFGSLMGIGDASSELELEVVSRCVDLFSELGIEVFVCPEIISGGLTDEDCATLSEIYCGTLSTGIQDLFEALPGLAGILWRSPFADPEFSWHPRNRDCTQYDLVLQELRLLESAVGPKKLIYYPAASGQRGTESICHWMSDLCDDAGPNTILAYSAVAGEPWRDSAELHPLWTKLRQRSQASATPLLPIINAGAVGQGHGLWPNLAVGKLESIVQRMHRHQFAGGISLAARLPETGSIAEAGLWAVGHVQWRRFSVEEWLETWFASRRPGEDFWEALKIFQRVRLISDALDQMSSENEETLGRESSERFRQKAQSLLGQLDDLKADYGEPSEEANGKLVSVRDHVTFFVRDGKRLLLDSLQKRHLSLASMFSGSDTLESFWTSMAGNEGRGIGFGACSNLLHEPNRGKEGSVMEAIYLASGFGAAQHQTRR